jgi:hypothetical protein
MAVDYAQGPIKIDAAFGDDIRDRRQAGLADMQERDNLGMTMWQDMLGETPEGGTTGAARIYNRGDARAYARDIGIDAEPGKPFENMSVEVDQAGRDNQAIRLDEASRLLAWNRRRNARNLPLLNRYIVNTAQPLRGVDERSALQDKIMHRICSLGRPGRSSAFV